MSEEKITTSDAEKAVDEGSYRSLPDDVLKEMHRVCINAIGPNSQAVERIRNKGALIKEELASREKYRIEHMNIVTPPPDEEMVENGGSTTKSLEQTWNEEKLKQIIRDKIEEDSSQEYKAAGALNRSDNAKKEITKDVSAMANSAGGVLIYGLAEYADPSRKHLAERIDPINRVEFSKEWLENIISQIRPKIEFLKIYSVQLSCSSDHVAYVIEIPKGATAHQANDFRYYRRYNFQCQPMPDHEVRDVMNRKETLRVQIHIKLLVYPRPNRDGTEGALIVDIKNETNVFARHLAFVVHAPPQIKGRWVHFENSILDKVENAHALRLSYSNHDAAPLFPGGTLRTIFGFRYVQQIHPVPERRLECFQWAVYAESMSKKIGAANVDEIYEEKHTSH